MCEIFAMTSRKKRDVNEYLKEFFSHSTQHPHGWGLANLYKNEVEIEKEPIQATKSHYLKNRLSVPYKGRNILAHIRYATIGNVEYQNCHPYTLKDRTGRRWTMIHNGTIFQYDPLNEYVKLQHGDTDSERILLYIRDRINQESRKKGQPLDAEERFFVLDQIISEMSKENKLNLLLFDGELLYVHTNYQSSLYQLAQEGRIYFSTTPLSGEHWQPVPMTTLLAFQEGEMVFRGTDHGNEYFSREDDLKFLYHIFSNL